MTEAASARPSSGALRSVLELARDIKLSHSVFALPFALLAMVLAAVWAQRTPDAVEIVLIVVGMVLARTVAMSVNRAADATIDAANPRTARRALPAGRVSRGFVAGAIAVCSALFILATAGFLVVRGNPWPLVLSPLVLAYLAGYSFTKRFTWLCHLYLGSALALSPVAAVIAIEPGFLARPEPWLLAGMVTCWVAGFDIIYALQDVAFDREHAVHSMPANLGAEVALWISRGLHVASAAALVALWQWSPMLNTAFLIATVAVIALLIVEHALVWGSRTHHIPLAFLTVNGVISLALGAAGIFDALRPTTLG